MKGTTLQGLSASRIRHRMTSGKLQQCLTLSIWPARTSGVNATCKCQCPTTWTNHIGTKKKQKNRWCWGCKHNWPTSAFHEWPGPVNFVTLLPYSFWHILPGHYCKEKTVPQVVNVNGQWKDEKGPNNSWNSSNACATTACIPHTCDIATWSMPKRH